MEQHYRAHASEASKLGSADVAAEYQRIKAEAAAKTAKHASECDALTAQLQVCVGRGGGVGRRSWERRGRRGGKGCGGEGCRLRL